LLADLYVNCLFSIPENNNSVEASLPRCKQRKSRAVAFKLLTELVKEYIWEGHRRRRREGRRRDGG
jgi:hypothetical protein